MSPTRFVMAALILVPPTGQPGKGPEHVIFSSGKLQLSGQLWKPMGRGRFPAVLFNHGSGKEPLRSVAPMAELFVAHGYIFFAPYRRGQGDSAGAGPYIKDLIDAETERSGIEAGQRLTVQLLETDHFDDQMAALSWLRERDDVLADDITVAGHSFGGIETMLAAQKASGIRAVVNFAGAAMNWSQNALIRELLFQAATGSRVPVLFVQAENDFSTEPSRELCAEMQRKRKECMTRIYPPHGSRAMEAHFFAYEAPQVWESDVFAFLDKARGKTAK